MDVLTVIIEVKGCWHRDLESAMETQLVDRYLRDSKMKHGLYVVGWYNCEKWDQNDWRQGRAPRFDQDEARRRFDIQAKSLSTEGRNIRATVLDTSLSH